MLNIALFGPPGTGKGTQSESLIKKYNQLHGVIKIDGMGTFDEVFARVSTAIENGFKTMGL